MEEMESGLICMCIVQLQKLKFEKKMFGKIYKFINKNYEISSETLNFIGYYKLFSFFLYLVALQIYIILSRKMGEIRKIRFYKYAILFLKFHFYCKVLNKHIVSYFKNSC